MRRYEKASRRIVESHRDREDDRRRRLSTPLRDLAWLLAVVSCTSPTNTLSVSGTVEIRDVRLAALTAGRVTRLLKDEGDTVRRGDTIAVLEQPGLAALIAQRRAQAQAAERRTAAVAAARVDSVRAAGDLERAGPLRAQGILSQQRYDDLEAAAAAAAAQLQAARAAASESRAAIQGLAVTEAIRDELVVIAPTDGIVLTRYLEPGEAAATGAPVVSVGVVSQPWIRAYVGERYLTRIRVGQRVSIHADGVPDSVSGRIIEISPRAEFTPRAAITERERADLVFGIKVEFDDPAGRLKAGLPVTLDVPLTP
jgi:HlyD family secretion protein